jgi:hypothetical protein
VVDSLLGDFWFFAEDFFELLFSALLLCSLVVVELLVFGLDSLVALSSVLVFADGLFVFVARGDFAVVAAGDDEDGACAVGVMVAPTEAEVAGVVVAPALAVAAGLALGLVEAAVLVVVPVVVVPVVPVVVVALTPKVVGTLTP